MRHCWRNYGLTITLLTSFLLLWGVGQAVSGRAVYNETRMRHGLAPVTMGEYWLTAHFVEATTENWESEFFQMGVYVYVTAFLFQKGSAESHDPDKGPPKEPPVTRRSPWPVRRGGWWRRCYGHSLSAAFLALFLLAFAGHAWSGWLLYNEEQGMEGRALLSFWGYTGEADLWFQSLQNWQSEFLAILSMVVLSIFLREKDSPESKPVPMAHADTE